MNLIAIMPIRNEGWVAGLSVRAALRWCDSIICLNHASTDATMDILQSIARETRKIVISEQPDPVWAEMDHRQYLLSIARNYGATHIALVDCDEVLTGNLLGTIRDTFEAIAKNHILTLPWLCLKNSIDKVHASGMWGDATVSAGFVDDPKYHWAAQDQGYHFHHRHPMGKQYAPYVPFKHRDAGLMHLQFLSERRLLAKQALYIAQEIVRWPGRRTIGEINQMYGRTVREHQAGTAQQVPTGWWEAYADLMQYLDVDAEPWQEAELKRLIAEHGAAKFKGADFFGVI